MHLTNIAIKKPTRPQLYLFFFYFFIFVFFLHNSFNYLDPDLGWHLKYGGETIKTGQVPSLETRLYPIEGSKWVDHEWLANALMFLIYGKANYIILSLFFACVLLLSFLILNSWIIAKNKTNKLKTIFLITLFEGLGIFAISPHVGVRVQEFGLLFLLLLLIIIDYYEQTKSKKAPFLLIPLLYFWSCLHGSFLISIFILFFWFFIKIGILLVDKLKIKNFFQLEDGKLSISEICYFLFLALTAIISTIFTPYRTKLYSFLSDYTDNFYKTHIQEWLPAFFTPFQYYQIIYTSIAFFIFVLYLLKIFHLFKQEKKIAIDIWPSALFIVFFTLAFISRRHFPLFFFVTLPFLIKIVLEQLLNDINKNSFELFAYLKTRIFFFFLFAVYLLTISMLLLKTNFTNAPFSSNKFCKNYPCKALEFIKNNQEYASLKIFNNYGWGGYLIWTWPEKKLFIDGRLPQYKVGEHTYLEEYFDFFNKGKVQKKVSEYQIEAVLLNRNLPKKRSWFDKVIFWKQKKEEQPKNELKDYLVNNRDWRLIYSDHTSEFYIKNENNQ